MVNHKRINPTPPPPFASRNKLNFPEHSPQMVTLWYRPPEILQNSVHYGTETDMWSLGCVMYQYIFNSPPVKGKEEVEQMRGYTNLRKGMKWREKSEKIQNTIGVQGFDLLQRLLILDPDRRITAHEALNHPWFHNIDLKLIPRRVKSPFSGIFENSAVHSE
jgi:cell division cycle 2-like protein